MSEPSALQRRRQRTRVPAVVWAGLLVLVVLSTRATWEQWHAYGRAVAMENDGQLADAVQEYRWTLRWYTPWGPVHGDAAAALVDIADRSEADDPKLAMEALDALRSGLIASRSFFQPSSDLVQMVNTRIPAIMVRVADRAGDRRDPAALLARFQADYARPVGVPAWASLAVSLGFVIWLLGMVLAFRHGFDEEGRWQRAGWRWLGASGAGLLCWTLAMWLA